ncbi:MAG: hypothetical protein ACYDC3_16040, partial [Candidatus Binataceae bacterium]
KKIRADLHQKIRKVSWPPGSSSFTIYPESGKGRGKGNGVTPIKAGLMDVLVKKRWKREQPLEIAVSRRPGGIDAVLRTRDGNLVALEWETGNISSSHRALNKMALGLLKGILAAGTLVVPSRRLYKFLTDRVGNFDELEPYLDLWRSLPCANGVLEIVVIEQDAESTSVRRIPKGTDGRALG